MMVDPAASLSSLTKFAPSARPKQLSAATPLHARPLLAQPSPRPQTSSSGSDLRDVKCPAYRLRGPGSWFDTPSRRQPLRRSVPGTMLDSNSGLEVDKQGALGFKGVHHVAIIVNDLQRSLDFYCGILGLTVNPERPDDKLPYAGAWLWMGPEMLHLMELPNPDPLVGRPAHGGRDRHFCVGVESVSAISDKLDEAGVEYTASKSGRPAIFFRDPDMNTLECVETAPWR